MMQSLSDCRRSAETHRLSRRRAWLALSALALLTACGGSDTSGPSAATGGFTIAASPATLNLPRNGTGTLTVTVTRSGNFTGAVNLAVSGLGTGVTGQFNPSSIGSGQTMSTLTVTAGATSTAGTANLTITASATGVANQTATVLLTITSPAQTGPFALSLSVNSYLALPPTLLQAMPVLTITRNAGFSGAVSFNTTGLPATLTVAYTPTSTTGNTTTVVVINSGAPNGTYTATIHGVATGGLGEQTVTLPIVVASPTTGSIQWQFCSHAARFPQYFLAVKDGSGPWTRIVPSQNATGVVYSFNLVQPTASVALVTPESGGYRTTVYQHTAQEFSALGASECALYPGVSTRTVNGTVTGVAAGELSVIGMGWWFGSTSGGPTSASYTLLNLPAGPLDLIGTRATVNAQAQIVVNRAIVRRGLNPASGASNAVLDFNSAESFAPTVSTWTFGNVNGEQFGITQHLTTATGSIGTLGALPGVDGAATVRTVYGIPLAQTIPGDLHQVIATIATNAAPLRATRQIIAYSRTLADRTFNFGPVLPTPAVGVVAGAPAGRLRAQGTLPVEYNSGMTLDITQGGTVRFATIHTTRGFLGAGASYDVQVPDVTAAIGWDTNFALRTGSPVAWIVSGGGPVFDIFDGRYIYNATHVRWAGALTGITAPADGSVFLMGRVAGTITP